MKEWLSRQEAADYLNCDPSRITRIKKEMEELGIMGIDSECNYLRIFRRALDLFLCARGRLKQAHPLEKEALIKRINTMVGTYADGIVKERS